MVSLLEIALRDLRQGQSAAARAALADLSVRIREERSSDPAGAAPPDLLALLGAVIREEGRPGEALLLFTTALTGPAGSPSAPAGNVLRGLLHAEIAACRRALAEPQSAIDSYRRALEIIPDDPDIRGGLASLLLETGVVVESITEFRAALSRAPGSARLQAGLGRALLIGGDPQSAAQVLAQAVQSSPADARPFLDLARASEALDRNADAARAYREYLTRTDATGSSEREAARKRLRELESGDDAVHEPDGTSPL
jgi:predicted Zn-dependent protease